MKGGLETVHLICGDGKRVIHSLCMLRHSLFWAMDLDLNTDQITVFFKQAFMLTAVDISLKVYIS